MGGPDFLLLRAEDFNYSLRNYLTHYKWLGHIIKMVIELCFFWQFNFLISIVSPCDEIYTHKKVCYYISRTFVSVSISAPLFSIDFEFIFTDVKFYDGIFLKISLKMMGVAHF